MRICIRLGVLVILGACFIAIERTNVIEAAVGCPERDQCLDQASANYNATIAYLNQEWTMCQQYASDWWNSCLNSANQEYQSCIYWAEMEYSYMVGRCEQITNPYERQACFDEAWTVYHQVESGCQTNRDAVNDSCWQVYNSDDQACTNTFIEGANQAQQYYSDEVSYCNTLCP